MKSTRWLILLLIILVIIISGYFIWSKYYSGRGIETTKVGSGIEKEKVVIGMNKLFSNLYPEIDADFYAYTFNLHIFETLATFNRENQITPVLAAKWDNPDDLTWRFYLSKKAKFSNGNPVSANDVKFTVDYLTSNKLPFAEVLPEIAEVKVIDDQTVEFKTSVPNPIFLNQIATSLLILSKDEIEKNGTKNNLGSGPYKLLSSSDKEITLSRNENYWNEKPKVKTVIFRLFSGEKAKVDALINNEIDLTNYGFAGLEILAKVQNAESNGQIQEKHVPDQSVAMLLLNLSSDPLKNEKTRKAIYQAINAKEIFDKVPAKGQEASQIVGSGIFGYNPKIKRLPYNIESAKQLMMEAGFESGFDLTIDYGETPGAKEYFQPIIEQLKKININVKLNGVEVEEYYNNIENGKIQAAIFTWSEDTMDAWQALNILIHSKNESSGTFNLGYSNTQVDQLIDESSKIINQKTRLQKLQQAMEIGMEEVAVIPLFQINSRYAISNSLLWTPRLDGGYRVWEMAGKGN